MPLGGITEDYNEWRPDTPFDGGNLQSLTLQVKPMETSEVKPMEMSEVDNQVVIVSEVDKPMEITEVDNQVVIVSEVDKPMEMSEVDNQVVIVSEVDKPMEMSEVGNQVVILSEVGNQVLGSRIKQPRKSPFIGSLDPPHWSRKKAELKKSTSNLDPATITLSPVKKAELRKSSSNLDPISISPGPKPTDSKDIYLADLEVLAELEIHRVSPSGLTKEIGLVSPTNPQRTRL
jgi:hypothetical protein